MELFKMCYDKFFTKRDLIRNMMGLCGNIAEVEELRVHLLHTHLILIFMCVLLSDKQFS